ncbi:uncharacterized protein [Drosophila tropicalis]|uniref:uncharacterized protein n=1 Tax=Drosophila tropicalis TaxID=46794 RepID=UPI0035ABAAC4
MNSLDFTPNGIGEHTCQCLRRYSRMPLKVFAVAITVYIWVLSSERFFAYWVETCIERTDAHVSDISFPSVTICPSKALNVNAAADQPLAMAYNMAQEVLCQTPTHMSDEDFETANEYGNFKLSDVITLFNYTCKDLFIECQWRHQKVDCCSIFKLLGPVDGLCYAFNSIRSINPDPTWPWSVADSGSYSGLNVKLNRHFKDITLTGVGIILHEPNQYLGNNVIYSSDYRIVIPVKPVRFTAEAEIKVRPVTMRRCFFTCQQQQDLEKIPSDSLVEVIVDVVYKISNAFTTISEETLFSYRSKLYFTSIDLLVSYGGIAGLILGCSAIGALNRFLDYFSCCRHHNK